MLTVIPLLIPNTLPYTLPTTTLFATCVIYGRLAHDNEILAVKAAGIPLTLEPQDFTPCRMFSINSPDGHSITFHKRKA